MGGNASSAPDLASAQLVIVNTVYAGRNAGLLGPLPGLTHDFTRTASKTASISCADHGPSSRNRCNSKRTVDLESIDHSFRAPSEAWHR